MDNNNLLTKALEDFPSWMKKRGFSPKWGYLLYPSRPITNFDRVPLDKILFRLSDLIKTQQIVKQVTDMAPVNLQLRDKFQNIDDQLNYWKDLQYLHEALVNIIGGYCNVLRKQGCKDTDLQIPLNLAQPLERCSAQLAIKHGPTTNYTIMWNFADQNLVFDNQIIKEGKIDDMTMADIKLMFCFTQKKKDEDLFFLVSVLSSYFMTRILQLIYQINCYIQHKPEDEQTIAAKLRQMTSYWKKINQQNAIVANELSGEVFYYDFRPNFCGYTEAKYEGFEERKTTNGGNSGYDPLFQMFQKGMGINYVNQELVQVQDTLRNDGMMHKHRQAVLEMAKWSKIREYCHYSQSAKQQYNQIMKRYQQFLEIHTSFIREFILKFEPGNYEKSKGISGTLIRKIYKKFEEIKAMIIP